MLYVFSCTLKNLLFLFLKQVEVGPNPSKDQLVGAVERHFISQVIIFS
jgi:hypothetical protein